MVPAWQTNCLAQQARGFCQFGEKIMIKKAPKRLAYCSILKIPGVKMCDVPQEKHLKGVMRVSRNEVGKCRISSRAGR